MWLALHTGYCMPGEGSGSAHEIDGW